MANLSLEERVKKLERDMELLKSRLGSARETSPDWLDRIRGAFRNDPMFEEAMKLGRESRESQRPKPRKKAKRSGRK